MGIIGTSTIIGAYRKNRLTLLRVLPFYQVLLISKLLLTQILEVLSIPVQCGFDGGGCDQERGEQQQQQQRRRRPRL